MSPASPTHPGRNNKRGARNFARLLMIIALAPLWLGAWGYYQGWRTLNWPTAEALILGSDLRISTSEHRRDDRTVTDQRATVDIRYTYKVDGRDYVGDGIEPYSYGMQNSAAARDQAWKYPANSKVRVAYDPDDATIAYLEPGPSSVSKMLLGIGVVLGLAGFWVRSLTRRGIGTMGGHEETARREGPR